MIDVKVEESKYSDLKAKEPHTAKEEDRMSGSYLSRGSNHGVRMADTSLDHPKAMAKSKFPIYRICLTGGPCAGKTTALSTLSTILSQLGFRVL